MLESDAMHHRSADLVGDGGVKWPAVTYRQSSVRKHDVRVTRAVLLGAACNRPVRPLIVSFAMAGVNGVGPDGMVEPLADEVEIKRYLPRLEARDGLGRRAIRVVESETWCQLNDERRPRQPGVAERVRRGHVDLPYGEPVAPDPRGGRGLAGPDHNRAA